MLMPQMTAGRANRRVILVTLLTSALVSISEPGPPFAPSTKAKMRLPIPEQYGMTKVPSTVPSMLLFMRSSRQIIRNDPAMNSPINHIGAQPVLSIQVINGIQSGDFDPWSQPLSQSARMTILRALQTLRAVRLRPSDFGLRICSRVPQKTHFPRRAKSYILAPVSLL